MEYNIHNYSVFSLPKTKNCRFVTRCTGTLVFLLYKNTDEGSLGRGG